jgi:hypothetical protein
VVPDIATTYWVLWFNDTECNNKVEFTPGLIGSYCYSPPNSIMAMYLDYDH